MEVFPEGCQHRIHMLHSSCTICCLYTCQLQHVAVAVNTACGVILAWAPFFLPENVAAPSKPMPTILPSHCFWGMWSLCKCSQHQPLLRFQKDSVGKPFSSHRQNTDNSSIAAISVHSSAMRLKKGAFWSLFKINSPTHVPIASIKLMLLWKYTLRSCLHFPLKLAIL